MMSEPMLLKPKLIDTLFLCVVLAAFISSGYARGAGGKGVVATVLEASGQSCPGLPPIAISNNRLYVAPNGNDAAFGTQEAPFATLGKAASLLPNGGTIIVRGGVYPTQPMFDAVGSKDVPLHIRAADGEKPIFDGSNIQEADSAVIFMESASHVVIEGLEVRNCLALGCKGIASDTPVLDLTIRGNHIHHMSASAARFAGRQIRIEDNDFHDVVLINENNTNFPYGGWPTCIGTIPNILKPSDPWANDVVIRANRIRNCWGEGIGVWYGSNVIVEDNSIENAWSAGIYADNSFNLSIVRNYIRMYRGTDGAGTGILLGLEDYTLWGLPNVRTSNVLVANNVVIAGDGIGWWSMPTPESTYESLYVLHNSIAGTQGKAIGIEPVRSGVKRPVNNAIANNVFYSVVEESAIGNPGAFILAGNAWINDAIPAMAGSTDVSLEIVFTDELLQQVQVNEAQPLAPLVGIGDARAALVDDFLCSERNMSAPVRGAFERL
jgi:Right handed beta helix region